MVTFYAFIFKKMLLTEIHNVFFECITFLDTVIISHYNTDLSQLGLGC